MEIKMFLKGSFGLTKPNGDFLTHYLHTYPLEATKYQKITAGMRGVIEELKIPVFPTFEEKLEDILNPTVSGNLLSRDAYHTALGIEPLPEMSDEDFELSAEDDPEYGRDSPRTKALLERIHALGALQAALDRAGGRSAQLDFEGGQRERLQKQFNVMHLDDFLSIVKGATDMCERDSGATGLNRSELADTFVLDLAERLAKDINIAYQARGIQPMYDALLTKISKPAEPT